MAGADGQKADDLIRRLGESPHGFDFFQALRKLECAHRDKPRIGSSDARTPDDDPIRLGQLPSTTFATSTLAGFATPPSNSGVPRLLVNFFGLLGPNGPMPLAFTEYVRAREFRHKDRTLARFLDIFHHRLLSLFYRAWAVNQKAVSHDRPEDDRFAAYVGSLMGVGMESLRGRDSVPDHAKLFFAGLLASQSRGCEGLAQILSAFFGVPVEVEPFSGRWIDLPEAYRCRLGESSQTGALGVNTIVGARAWDCQQKFRIRIGPLSLDQFTRLLPTEGNVHHQRLIDWVRLYCSDPLDWDAQLILKRDEAPPLQLGRGAMLGWTTWLKVKPLTRDADDLILRPAPPNSASAPN